MNCIFCGYEVGEYTACPNCGRDLTVYRKIRLSSDLCYNQGLSKAQSRDLSGAIDELTQALKYDKYNTQARNLLGLVYFEIGESVNAMGEWVISKNLQPDNNLADEYLAQLQGNPAVLNAMDNATKIYNQAVEYIHKEDFDLAKIQLKRLVQKYPKMIRARSLLALLYLRGKEIRAARKELLEAGRIDVGNPTINSYLQEIKMGIRRENESRYNKKKDKDAGSEPIVADSEKMSYIMDYSKTSVVNILIGAIIGVLISLFLLFPALRQRNNSDVMQALISAHDDARSTENDITAMEQSIDALNSELNKYKGQEDVRGSYEALFSVMSFSNSGNIASAAELFPGINRELLGDKGKESYDRISEPIVSNILQTQFGAASELFNAGDYEGAMPILEQVVARQETYNDGNALFNLAECYANTGNTEAALNTFRRITEIYSGRRLGRLAETKIQELTSPVEE